MEFESSDEDGGFANGFGFSSGSAGLFDVNEESGGGAADEFESFGETDRFENGFCFGEFEAENGFGFTPVENLLGCIWVASCLDIPRLFE